MISKENLFSRYQPEEEESTERHLTLVEGYVLRDLPSDLSQIRRGDLSYDELA